MRACSSHALSSIAGKAGHDAAHEAHEAHERPGEHVVSCHEASRVDLVRAVAFFAGVQNLPREFVFFIRSEFAARAESPDNAGNPPGGKAAADAAGEVHADHFDERRALNKDGTEALEATNYDVVEEAPGEPSHEVVVNVVEVKSLGGRF